MNTKNIEARFGEMLDLMRDSFATFTKQSVEVMISTRPLAIATDEAIADPAALALDQAIYKAAPVLAIPVHTEFAPLLEPGHRFLLASDGLYLEVRRPWLHFIQRLAEHTTDVRIPYGSLAPKVELAFGSLGNALAEMKLFAAHARAQHPIEAAASLIWDHGSRLWAIKYPKVIGTATTGSIQFEQVDLAENESLVIDLHSHGQLPAFFSGTDNADDAGTVKIAGVFGNLDLDLPSVEFRLCVLGMYITVPVPAEKIFGA